MCQRGEPRKSARQHAGGDPRCGADCCTYSSSAVRPRKSARGQGERLLYELLYARGVQQSARLLRAPIDLRREAEHASERASIDAEELRGPHLVAAVLLERS